MSPFEFAQINNGGPTIKIDEGWLTATYGLAQFAIIALAHAFSTASAFQTASPHNVSAAADNFTTFATVLHDRMLASMT